MGTCCGDDKKKSEAAACEPAVGMTKRKAKRLHVNLLWG
jgi:hypothetical protein